MKKILLFALSGLLIASCANEEFEGGQSAIESSNGEISFSMSKPNLTRSTDNLVGDAAAEKLGNNFIVYGFKYFTSEPTSAGDVADKTKQQDVFTRYNVNYEKANTNTTKTNTNGWEYVGYNDEDGKVQTIKYWDYKASGYVFSAVSGTGIKAEKIASGSTVYDKGWNVTVPAGGSLGSLYASARNPQLKPTDQGEYQTVVMTFYSMVTKVRFALYETVPGYSIHIDKFYYENAGWKNTTTNFAITGNFRALNSAAETPLKITYNDATVPEVENRPVVSIDESKVAKESCKLFGTNIQAQSAIGTTSSTATYDQAGGEYTCILPYQSDANVLKLYVDYTLKAENGEEIHVSHASASVPANYTQWKANFAYTYIFKISDKSNGTTGDTEDPDDPTKPNKDPEGLYPITFDACVINAEEGVQESVTTVSEPSITTYAKGVNATANAEYEAGDVYYSINQSNSLVDCSAAKVYEVNNYAGGEVTEALVEDYLTNKVVLTPVQTTPATAVPLSDGSEMTFAANKCYKFAAAAGKTYAIQFEYTSGKYIYKVVKVSGTPAAPSYELTCAAGQTIATQTGTAEVVLTNSSKGVEGAKSLFTVFNAYNYDVTDNFTIVDAGAGKYTVQLTDATIQAGADGTYTVKFNGTTVANNAFNVNLGYAFKDLKDVALSNNTIYVVAGNSNSFKFTTGSASTTVVSNAVITGLPIGITIKEEEATPGTYKVSVDASVNYGLYSVKVAGKELNIVVYSYAFSGDVDFTLNYEGNASPKTLQFKENDSPISLDVAKMTGINSAVATIVNAGSGNYTVTPVAQGSYTVKYENAASKITVNQYTLTPTNYSITKSTGASTIVLKLNGNQVNASSSKVQVFKGSSLVTSGYTLTANGKYLIFSNVTATGTYIFKYIVDGVDVAHTAIDVVE